MKKFLFIAVLILSSLTLAGCTPTTTNQNNDTLGQQQDVDFTITASHMQFSPNRIEVEAGSTITIRVNSVDEVHDFVIDELNVDSGLLGAGRGTVLTITVPADASGQVYEFYCSVGSHRAMGMVGSLVVK